MKPIYPDPNLPPFLIVDDCDDDVFLLRHRLRDGGITNPIYTFTSPSGALSFLHSLHDPTKLPGFIFTDIRMPLECGFSLISAIRENTEWDSIHIVVITSSSDTTDWDRALHCGANGYLVKFPPSALLAEFVHHGPWFASRRHAAGVNPVPA